MKSKLLLVSALMFMSLSCGSSNPEEVYLYIFNGYAGASKIDVIGPTGTLISGLKFGERAESKKPLNFNRNLGSEFTVIVDGAPTTFPAPEELFSLYPQETATMIFSRRSASGEVATNIVRHRQSVTSVSLLSIINSLSLSNQYTSESNNAYSFGIEFKYTNPSDVGYRQGDEGTILHECGALQMSQLSQSHSEIIRKVAGQPVASYAKENGWFFSVPCGDTEEGVGGFCYRTGLPLSPTKDPVDGWVTYVNQDGAINGISSTAEYLECLTGAMKFVSKNKDNPCDGFSADTVTFDGKALQECLAPKSISLPLVDPPGAGSNQIDFYFSQQNEVTFRVRTPGMDGIFGDPDNPTNIVNQDEGRLLSFTVDLPNKSQIFYAIYGRPVSPRIFNWNSADSIVSLKNKPYPDSK